MGYFIKNNNKTDKKGFTLVEVLTVIVILGILVGLGVSAYSTYLAKSRKKSYNIAETGLRNAATSAITDCLTGNGKNRDFCKTHDILANKYEHEVILLEELINDDYMNPIRDPYDTEKFCNTGGIEENGSYVYIINSSNTDNVNNVNFQYKVCLKCGDYSSEECLGDDLNNTYDFDASCVVTYDEAGTQLYDGNWTDKDLYLTFTASGDYRYGLKYYLYRIGDGLEKRVEIGEDNKVVVPVKTTVDDEKINMTVIDGLGTSVTTKCGNSNVKIDKEKIISAKLSGKFKSTGKKIGNNDKWVWAGEDVILTITTDPKSIPSGYYYQWYKDGVKIGNLTTSNTYIATEDGTYHAEVTNSLSNQTVQTNKLAYKFDRTKPIINTKSNPFISTSQSYNFINNVTSQFGISGGTTTCSPSTSSKLGQYTVTCTAKGNNTLSTTISFIAQIDNTKPTITAKSNPFISTSQSYNFINNVTSQFGISGGTTTCSPSTSSKLGQYTVTCTAKGNNTLSTTISFIAQIDNTKPTITAKSDPIALGNQDYNFVDNVTYTFGISGGKVTCNPASSLKTGVYNVTCTAKGNNGLSTVVTFKVQHSYQGTLVPNTCGGGCNRYYTNCQYISQGDTAGNHWSCNCGSDTDRLTNNDSGKCCDWNPSYDCSYWDCPLGGTADQSTGICSY